MTRVLVVDDEKSIRITLREFLRDANYEVAVAENAEDALRLLASTHFHVVVSDIIMPRVTGVKLLESIKSSSPHVQVVLITGEPTVETSAAAVRAGAFDYLSKPVRKDRLLRVVANAAAIALLEADKQRLEQDNRRYRGDLEELVEERTAALVASEARLRVLADHATDVIWTADLDLTPTYISPAIREVTGYTAEEAMARILGEHVNPAPLEAAETQLQEALERARLGRCRPEERLRSRLELTRKDGTKVWLDTSARLLFDDEMNASGILGISRDITEHLLLEQENVELQAQYLHAQKMEAIGRLAGGVAHDFNNLLTVINSYSGMLVEDLSPTDPMRDDVEQVLRAGMRAAELTGQLLAFSRKQMLETKVVNLNEIVREMEKMLRRVIGEDIEFRTSLDGNLGNIVADPSQIEQAVMNLAINARDAMPAGGVLTLETTTDEKRERCATDSIYPSGPCALLKISDNGIGMDDETQELVFEPFFTTKAAASGTGLGLATAYGIVKQSGGHISLESELGVGSTFTICLPIVDAVKTSPAEVIRLGDRHCTETILLVEDEEVVRTLTRRLLVRAGYTVIVAANAGEALLHCERHGREIHLMLTDIVMPQMNGQELADRLAVVRPSMRVMFMSGYPDGKVNLVGGADSRRVFLAKPFTRSQLLQAVAMELRDQALKS